MINYNVTPTLIENIFTDEQYAFLYEQINKTPKQLISEIADTGYLAKSDPTKNFLGDIIKSRAEELAGVELTKYMTHHARYTLKSNNIPRLNPHYDRNLEFPTFTLSIILDSTFDWDLYAEAVHIPVRKNTAAFFSGSHQVHWRPFHAFKEDDYYDILVCQFRVKDSLETISDEHREMIDQKVGPYMAQYYRDYPPFPYSPKEWLQKEYVDNNRSIAELCEELKVPAEVLSFFLRKYDIAIRNT